MKVMIAAAAMTLIASSASAAGMTTIRPSEAISQQGSLVTVEGVASVHKDGARSGMDVALTGSDNSRMNAFIPIQAQDLFPGLESYDGKTVDVTGVVLFDQGRPEIRVVRPNQLKLAAD
jgi:DNA/RNA endonuclease YhcR with UshA esterase domain